MVSIKKLLEKVTTSINTLTTTVNAMSTDYIIEENYSNYWHYRKWNSGLVECWYERTVYSNGNINGVEILLPVTFLTCRNIQANATGDGFIAQYVGHNCWQSTSNKVIGTLQPAGNYDYKIYAVGTWK